MSWDKLKAGLRAKWIGVVAITLWMGLAVLAEFYPKRFPAMFGGVAILVSIFYAFEAVTLFVSSERRPSKAVVWGHQIWLNFLGSILGWCMLYVVLRRLLPSLGGSPKELSAGDFGLILVAFIGMSGHLPYAVIAPITELVKKAAEKLAPGD